MDLLTRFLSGQLLVYFHGATEEQLDAFENITGTCWKTDNHIKDRMEYADDKHFCCLVYKDDRLLRTSSDEREVISIENFIQKCLTNNIEENDVMEVFT